MRLRAQHILVLTVDEDSSLVEDRGMPMPAYVAKWLLPYRPDHIYPAGSPANARRIRAWMRKWLKRERDGR